MPRFLVGCVGLLAQNDATGFLGHVLQIDIEAFAVLVTPGGTDARPVGLLAFASNVKEPVARTDWGVGLCF